MRAIVKAALAIPEMKFAFECICADDNKTPSDYTDKEIIEEAKYRLSTYFEDGHMNNDMRTGDNCSHDDLTGEQAQKIANKDIRMLQAFLKKYKAN
jgi:hypothetical protein